MRSRSPWWKGFSRLLTPGGPHNSAFSFPEETRAAHNSKKTFPAEGRAAHNSRISFPGSASVPHNSGFSFPVCGVCSSVPLPSSSRPTCTGSQCLLIEPVESATTSKTAQGRQPKMPASFTVSRSCPMLRGPDARHQAASRHDAEGRLRDAHLVEGEPVAHRAAVAPHRFFGDLAVAGEPVPHRASVAPHDGARAALEVPDGLGVGPTLCG